MIKNLRIKNLGFIDAVDLDLQDSLVAITGETGAGKTMVLTAIDALLGKKIKLSLISEGKPTLVEAVLDFSSPKLQKLVEKYELELEDDRLIVSRSFSKDSKNRNFLGGRSVPASLIGEIMEQLIFIHGQKDQSRLSKSAFALAAVDGFAPGAHSTLVEEHRSLFKVWQAERAELADFQEKEAADRRDREKLEQLIIDINEVNPIPQEDEIIDQKISNLHNLEKITKTLNQIVNLNESDTLEQLNDIQRSLSNWDEGDFEFATLKNQITHVIEDLNSFIGQALRLSDRFEEKIDVDALEARKFKINRIMKLYGPSLEDALRALSEAEKVIAKLNDPGGFKDKLQSRLAKTEKELISLANEISKNRIKVAQEVSLAVTQELADLMLPEAEFIVRVQAGVTLGDDHSANGIDRVEFLFRSNKKLDLGLVSKIASGGELSRLMLALEVVLSKDKSDQVMIFDEIDAGVGGKAAIEIGKRLKALSQKSQVLLVTHLPQVAAFANQQLVVEKNQSAERVLTTVKPVEAEERRLELSRMLAGLEGSESALQHADELLALAQTSKR